MLKSVLKSGSALVIVLLFATPAFSENRRPSVQELLSNAHNNGPTSHQNEHDSQAIINDQDEANKTDFEKRDELERTLRLCNQRQQLETMIGSGQINGPMPRMPDQNACDKASKDLAALNKPPTNDSEALPDVTPEPPATPIQ